MKQRYSAICIVVLVAVLLSPASGQKKCELGPGGDGRKIEYFVGQEPGEVEAKANV